MEPAKTTPLWLLIAAWLLVTLPATWGVTQTVKRSLDLFRAAPAAATAPATRPLGR